MADFYVPKSKKELLDWLKKYHEARGQTFSGFNKKPLKQLYAIFYSLRAEHDKGAK